MTTAIETIYRVVTETNEDGGQYFAVLDQDGDEVDSYEPRKDAEIEASDRNTNAAIEDAIGGLETLLDSLTTSTRPEVLQAIRAMIETAEKLADEE